jgi:hypothetical protein
MLTHETLAGLLQSKFNVAVSDDQQVELVLETVSELKLTDRQEQFSIVFRGPAQIFLEQGMRDFKHEQLGAFTLFLVPIAHDEQGFLYESVFNRMRKQPENS